MRDLRSWNLILENKPTVTPSENPSFAFLQVKDLLVSNLQNEESEAIWTLQMSNPWNYEQVKIDWVFRRSICFCCEKCGLIFHFYSWSHDFFRANICCHFNHLLFFFPFQEGGAVPCLVFTAWFTGFFFSVRSMIFFFFASILF